MSLIDRYVAEVGRNLPEKDRSDIEAEIRSMVEDIVEERGRQAGKSTDDKMITATLEKLGDPRTLAAQYAPPRRYLIGPGWYDVYIMTLRRILLIALPIYAAVTITLTLAANPLEILNAVLNVLTGAFNVGVQAFFWVTVVFVLMERSDAIPGGPLLPSMGKWTISQLPELPKKRQIPVTESLMNIAFILFVLAWIILPATLAYFQGQSGHAPYLNPDLWNFWLPALFVIMGLTLVHDLFQLKIGNWTRPLMITNVILGLVSVLYIAALVLTQQVINPAFLATVADSMTPSDLQNAATWAAWSVNITAAILIGIYIWGIVHSVHMARLFDQDSQQPTKQEEQSRRRLK